MDDNNPTAGAAGLLQGGNPDPNPNPTQGGDDAFLQGFEEADRAYLTEKGYNSKEDLLAALRAADGKVALPTEKSTPEELSAFYNKLGRPESADKYGLTLKNDENGEVAKALAPAMFDAGLTATQAAKMQEALDGFSAAQVEGYAKEQDSQMKALQKDWGADYEKNTEIARQAARKYGLTQDKLVRLETALGSNELMKLMYSIGSTIADPDLKGATGSSAKPSGAHYTKEEAAAKMEELTKDKEFGKKFMNKDPDAIKLFNELNHAMAGGN